MSNTFAAAALAIAILVLSPYVVGADGQDGFALYEANCAKCHSKIASTTIPGRSYSRIKSAIRTNVGGMGRFLDMKDEELKAISDVLLVAGDPDNIDGRKIYAVLCSGCHKGLEHSTIEGATADDIRAAAKEKKCNTDHANVLNDTFIEKVAAVLKPGGE